MKTFELNKVLSCDNLIKSTPTKDHYDTVIKSDTIFTKEGRTVGLYVKIPKSELTEIRRACLTTNYVKTYRTLKALPTQSSVFGSLPRVPLRNDYCRYSQQTKNERDNANRIFSFQSTLLRIYKEYLPNNLQTDTEKVNNQVNGDYLLVEGSPFATANINVNHAIKYHRDTGNFKGNLSNVLILRDGIIGGELVFPEYRVALSQEDGYLAIFDGQSEVHGVMPIIKTKENPYRASIVYYTLENMKHCYPFKMEVERLQQLTTERAYKRAKGIDPRG